MPGSLKNMLLALATQDIGQTYHDESLADHCSWRIGGPADLLVEPVSIAQIITLISYTHKHQIPLVVIGQGTNLLFDDAGLRGVALKLGSAFSRIHIDGNIISAEAGAWVPQLARLAMRAGLAGLEHCIGIPGTLGGLVLMNGGSQRKGIGENIRRVWLVDSTGRLQIRSQAECDFAYRSSVLQGEAVVVVKAELECAAGELATIRREMVCDLRERRRKFPRKTPNCGSVFLSTSKMHTSVGPPGQIIEAAGLKGLRCGAAEVSQQHANFILNTGGASSADVLALIAHIRRIVLDQIGFDLHCEVRYVSPQGVVMPADQAQK
ncbi:UDP-N-acetylmuramate dehydrogenase [Geopsychrobacter electrodiphilus]|uniref:UDP-N-acetylmuramate dehydrogenase n=1 Tax=Geopsychrobacter electrodiphilus TaxID=225196 RepID=UPI0003A4AEB0|nr:UDP-N-acetylmuramate dehydrogenase [Geopsychrobacter electrodiphilus]